MCQYVRDNKCVLEDSCVCHGFKDNTGGVPELLPEFDEERNDFVFPMYSTTGG